MSNFIESSYFDKYGNKKQKYLNIDQVIFVFPNKNPEWTEVIVASGQMYFLQEPISSVMNKINQKTKGK